ICARPASSAHHLCVTLAREGFCRLARTLSIDRPCPPAPPFGNLTAATRPLSAHARIDTPRTCQRRAYGV
ncbi:MAG: hypothetical protein ABTS22_17125, partial [Accumulibacter sp.]